MRVAVTTAYGYWSAWSPDDIFEPGGKGMIGGGETAMIWLSTGLAAAGHDVDLFYDTARPGNYHGVNYLPKTLREHLLASKDYDLLIAWEDYPAISMAHRAKCVILAMQCNQLEMGVRDYGVDAYQAVSRWHVNRLITSDPTAPLNPEKFFVFPNGVDLRRYEQQTPPRDPFRVIHSSSPDRGLHHLVEAWPRIKRKVPEANLHLFYDMSKWFQTVDDQRRVLGQILNTTERADRLREALRKAEGLDVVLHGAVDQWTLAREQLQSSIACYPCDPVQGSEGFSCTILEYLAAGIPTITTNADAFPELWPDHTIQLPLPLNQDDLVELVVEGLRNRDTEKWQGMADRGREFAQQFSWVELGKVYARFVEDTVTSKQKVLEEEREIVEVLP